MSNRSDWDPEQYERFAAERAEPFRDLISMVDPVPGGRVADLGCGAGGLTVKVHEHTGATETLGFDTSRAFIDKASALDVAGVRFIHADLRTAGEHGPFDALVSNAVLHWVPDHQRVLRDLTAVLSPGGQLAIQVPANFDHPSHTCAAEVLRRSEYSAAGGAKLVTTPGRNLLPPEQYATLLHDLGYEAQHVRLQVYGHVLATTSEIVEWTAGSLLTPVRNAFASNPGSYERFVDDYRERLIGVLGESSPYYFTFKRILMWARLPGDNPGLH